MLAVELAGGDARVAIIEDSGWISAFFPFQLKGWGFGESQLERPSLTTMASFVLPASNATSCRLIEACGLVAWSFDYLLLSQKYFSKFLRRTESSPFVARRQLPTLSTI